MAFISVINGGSGDAGGGSPPNSGQIPGVVGSSGSGSQSSGGLPPNTNLSLLPVTGGLQGIEPALLVIGFDFIANNFLFYELDPTNFNCEEDVEYDFRVEEVEPGNQLTIHNILIRYRDLGVVTFNVIIQNADGVLVSKPYTVGNTPPTNKIRTLKTDLLATGEALQIVVKRSAGKGPLAITKVRAWGSYGDGDII